MEEEPHKEILIVDQSLHWKPVGPSAAVTATVTAAVTAGSAAVTAGSADICHMVQPPIWPCSVIFQHSATSPVIIQKYINVVTSMV